MLPEKDTHCCCCCCRCCCEWRCYNRNERLAAAGGAGGGVRDGHYYHFQVLVDVVVWEKADCKSQMEGAAVSASVAAGLPLSYYYYDYYRSKVKKLST